MGVATRTGSGSMIKIDILKKNYPFVDAILQYKPSAEMHRITGIVISIIKTHHQYSILRRYH